MTAPVGAQPRTQPLAGPVDWVARWVAKFLVYQQRRFGAAATPQQEADFVRFTAVRWPTPEWQQNQAQAALRAHCGLPASASSPSPGQPSAPGRGSVPPPPRKPSSAEDPSMRRPICDPRWGICGVR